ncbi:MAG TPA: hypothetical protein DCS49_02600 [Gammaproteobacteria bacterium]|nr:hypothetical protein [Gammaproteobacteria bacterium]
MCRADSENTIDFYTLAQDSPVMLWITNRTGENIFSNKNYRQFIGEEKIEKLGQNAWLQALHPDDKNHCLDIFHTAFKTHQAFEMEYRLQRHDGEYHYILDRGVPYADEAGHFAGFVGSSTDITDRKFSEEEMKRSHQELMRYNQEMSLINELNSYLQVCRALTETYPVICHYAEKIFPDWAGAIYLFDDTKTVAQIATKWGHQNIESKETILPGGCWSLRQGKVHQAVSDDNNLLCHHVTSDKFKYYCIPIMAQGEILGVLHIEYFGDIKNNNKNNQRYFESRRRLTKTMADNLGLSLVSLKLREALKNQSIRDPLTGLYNRRYMEESLQRELAACKRVNQGMGVIIVDIDYFKKFNDEFGHDAGDIILVEFSRFMETHFRKSDIICRYGGEEFVVIMPTAPETLVLSRANDICEKLHSLNVFHQGRKLPSITASFGVAYISPDNYQQASIVVKLADTALYEAKNNGRNQVMVYHSGLELT